MAICKKCGKENPDDSKFCTGCGAQLVPDDHTTVCPPASNSEVDASAIFTFGLLSIVLSGVVGLIFAIIAKKRVAGYKATGCNLTGLASAGDIMSRVGFILSIVSIAAVVVLLTVYFSVLFLVLLGSVA